MLAIVIKFLIGHIIVALMLSIGLAADRRDLTQLVRKPRFYLRALLVMEIGVPLLAMAVVSVLGTPPVGTALILLMAICPGAPLIAVHKSKGERYSVVGLNLLVAASVLAPITIPAWVAVLDRVYPYDLHISVLQVVTRVLEVVLVPLALGVLIRLLLPRTADVLWRVVHYFFLVALAVTLVAALILGAPVFLEAAPIVLVAVVLMVVGSAAMGLWAARYEPAARHATAVAAVLGNPGLVLAIIAASFPDVRQLRAAAFIFAYLILRKVVLLPIEVWIKRRGTPGRSAPARRQDTMTAAHAGAHPR